jgi:nucleoside-diphosphate-sugar epimerase
MASRYPFREIVDRRWRPGTPLDMGAGLNVVVVGATGNVGTGVVSALAADSEVALITGVARRRPEWTAPKTGWVTRDVAEDDLRGVFDGADAVVHLAWLFQPTRDPAATWRANVLGSLRVFDAAATAGVPTLVYASSVGAYSPGDKDHAVDESWPTHGWPGAAYTREKAYVERALDAFELRHPSMRVVRLRPAFIFKRESAQGQRRLFGGPFVPNRLVRPELIPAVPDVPGLRFQALHTADAAQAYRLAVRRPVRGAFNIAAEPVVDPALLAECLDARLVRVPAGAVRTFAAALWHLRLVPAAPELLDAVLRMPLMDTTRARTELGWSPQHTAADAITQLLGGLAAGAGMATPPLAPAIPGGRLGELHTGVGERP